MFTATPNATATSTGTGTGSKDSVGTNHHSVTSSSMHDFKPPLKGYRDLSTTNASVSASASDMRQIHRTSSANSLTSTSGSSVTDMTSPQKVTVSSQFTSPLSASSTGSYNNPSVNPNLNNNQLPKRKPSTSLLPVNRKSTNLLTMLIPTSSGMLYVYIVLSGTHMSSVVAMADSLIMGGSSNTTNIHSLTRSAVSNSPCLSTHSSTSGTGTTGSDRNENLGIPVHSSSSSNNINNNKAMISNSSSNTNLNNPLSLSTISRTNTTTILTQISQEDAG